MSYNYEMTVPDGSLGKPVHDLLAKAGMEVKYSGDRSYQGVISGSHLFLPAHAGVPRMRPQDGIWLVADDRFQLGFAGNDLIVESDRADELEILKEYPISRGRMGKTRVVVAVHDRSGIEQVSDIKPYHILVTEYPRIAARFLQQHGLQAKIRRCHGATEAFGQQGKDMIAQLIIENVETGDTLAANGWREVETIMESRLCVFVSKKQMGWPEFRHWTSEFILQLDSVMDAIGKVMVTFNIASAEDLERVLKILEDKTPTVCGLAGRQGHAVEVLLDDHRAPEVISRLKHIGATAIVQTRVDRLVP